MPGSVIKKGDPFGTEKLPAPLRGLVDFIAPQDDPFGGLAVAPISPSILKQAGIKTLERVRTLPSLSGLGHEAVSALTMLQQRYPRLFGTVKDIGVDPLDDVPIGMIRLGRQFPIGPYSKIELAPNMSFDQALNTGAHELAHAAQSVRKPYSSEYGMWNKAVGYKHNPLEKTANIAGENAVNRVRNAKIKPGPSDYPYKADAGLEAVEAAYPTPRVAAPWAGLQKIREKLGF